MASLLPLCFTFSVERGGTYSQGNQGKDRIAHPVTRVPTTRHEAPREADAPVARVHEGSGGLVNRTARWALAVVFVGLLGGVTYIVTSFFTREHQIDHLEGQVQQQQRTIEALMLENQEMERRLVILETQLETMQESSL